MPVKTPDPTKDKTATPDASATKPNSDAALREDWNKLSKEDQDTYFQSLPAREQVQFATRVGLFDSKEPIGVSAPPKVGSIPWMKQKALATLNWGANQLPTVGGVAGGAAGGLVGGVINPAGGEIVGSVVGAGVGGAQGEYARQRIQDATGFNQYEDPAKKTGSYRFNEAVKEGAGQAAGEAFGQLGGKWIRPTLERSLAKLYYAGKLNYGNPLGKGDLETVIDDVMKAEKGTKAVTVGDFYGAINSAKKDVGKEVDDQFSIPFTQHGKTTTLGMAEADPTNIIHAINSVALADPSITKEALVDKSGPAAAYVQQIKKEALKFQQQPWTYSELSSKRIRLNQELAPLYLLPAGEQRVYLLQHPDLAFKKAEADAIRDVVYPQMDILSGKPMGTTLALQEKRGALMSLENQVNEHLGTLKTKSRQAAGAPLTEKANVSSYGTSSGKPGFAVHRLTSLVHTPNPERNADKKVAQAFGNTVGSKVRKFVTTPAGSKRLGDELLSMPLRELVNPSSKKPEDQAPPGPQSSVAKPKDLIEKAKQLNPAAQAQVAYNHYAINPATGHHIGHDGKTWRDLKTGAEVA